VAAFATPQIGGIDPDIALQDGDQIGGWTALHTPGHASDHLCFARADGVVFSADHVMSWSSSIISPPQGDMRAYFASLHRLLARTDTIYLPGHGPPITEPRPFALGLLAHRQAREDGVLAALAAGPATPEGLVGVIYVGLAERLRAAAARNVVAHLHKLQFEGRVSESGGAYALTP
jgi:glyoxylase-like metal-dependent hydrolase (beta-lactamase superfamily II)